MTAARVHKLSDRSRGADCSADELGAIRCPNCGQRAERGVCLARCGDRPPEPTPAEPSPLEWLMHRLYAGKPVSRERCVDRWGPDLGNRLWESDWSRSE